MCGEVSLLLSSGVRTGEVGALVAGPFGWLDGAVGSGLVVEAFEGVGVEAVAERSGLAEIGGGCAEADVLGEQAG